MPGDSKKKINPRTRGDSVPAGDIPLEAKIDLMMKKFEQMEANMVTQLLEVREEASSKWGKLHQADMSS